MLWKCVEIKGIEGIGYGWGWGVDFDGFSKVFGAPHLNIANSRKARACTSFANKMAGTWGKVPKTMCFSIRNSTYTTSCGW